MQVEWKTTQNYMQSRFKMGRVNIFPSKAVFSDHLVSVLSFAKMLTFLKIFILNENCCEHTIK